MLPCCLPDETSSWSGPTDSLCRLECIEQHMGQVLCPAADNATSQTQAPSVPPGVCMTSADCSSVETCDTFSECSLQTKVGSGVQHSLKRSRRGTAKQAFRLCACRSQHESSAGHMPYLTGSQSYRKRIHKLATHRTRKFSKQQTCIPACSATHLPALTSTSVVAVARTSAPYMPISWPCLTRARASLTCK